MQQKLRATLQAAVSRANVAFLNAHPAGPRGPTARAAAAAAGDPLATVDAVAAAVAAELGEGMVVPAIEAWVRDSRFPDEPHLFAPAMRDSVYGGDLFGKPPTLVDLSPTVRVFGTHCGTDKIGHFVQQGHQYYETYRRAERAGRDPADCLRAAVDEGVFQEQTIFGLMTVGVYSNADLAANYAGLKFFLNLARPVVVGGRRRPPVLVRRHGLWAFNPDLPPDFLRPYVSDHWDESLNPNLYTGVLLGTVRARFPGRAPAWAAARRVDVKTAAGRAAALATFYGEAYGHCGVDQLETVADLWPRAAPARARGASQHAAVDRR